MATDTGAVIDDLAAEHSAAEELVRDVDLGLPTLARGWSIRDTIHHLLVGDQAALMTLCEPDRFEERRSAGRGAAAAALAPEPGELLATWRATHDAVIDALRQANPSARVAWYGPSMSLRTFASARLMEYWAHGEDIAQAANARLPATSRLKNVCHLGVATRAFSFVAHGEPPPEAEVSVILTAPEGDTWSWGDQDSPESVTGPARDFCLVVTQRRHVEDTRLRVQGPGALAWMRQAQAFAGPPTTTDIARRGIKY